MCGPLDDPWDVYLEFPADKDILSGIECLDGRLLALGTVGDLSGLEALQVISSNLVFANEGPLANAKGLSGLKMIGGDLAVVVDSEVEDFSGLENLESIGGSIYSSGGLKAFDGLQGVSHVGGGIFIGTPNVQDVPSFVSAKALAGLPELGGSINLIGTSMSTLEELDQLEMINGELAVMYNPLLPTCIVKALADKTAPKNVLIVGNLADACGN